jgi:hypothetical protein
MGDHLPGDTVTTHYEHNKPCLVNFKTTRAWREAAHQQAREHGMNLGEYLRHLVDHDLDETHWRTIADDLYQQLRQHPDPTPPAVTNALIAYERRQQART